MYKFIQRERGVAHPISSNIGHPNKAFVLMALPFFGITKINKAVHSHPLAPKSKRPDGYAF